VQDALCWLVVNSNRDFEPLTNFLGDVTPLALVVLYFYFVVVHELALLAGALAWLTHVAVDRTLGFGLRWLPTSRPYRLSRLV
jgi:uncharacterized membrane protein